MTIAELGRRSGVGIETVRYYQRLGLLRVPMAPTPRAHRRYGEDALAELRFVRRCKDLGFRLRDIAVLAQLRRDGSPRCDRLHEELSRLTERLDAERREIEGRLVSVRTLLTACAGGRSLSDCGSFAAIEKSVAGD